MEPYNACVYDDASKYTDLVETSTTELKGVLQKRLMGRFPAYNWRPKSPCKCELEKVSAG